MMVVVGLRRCLIALALAVSAAACLFPSLDNLDGKGTGPDASPTTGDDDDGKTKVTTTTTTSTRTTDASADANSPDATVDAGPPLPTTFVCPDGPSCQRGTEVCCAPNANGQRCFTNASAPNDCPGGFIACSDNGDCAPGQSCCINEVAQSGLLAQCKTACATGENTLCDPNKSNCPAGKSCTGEDQSQIPFCQ